MAARTALIYAVLAGLWIGISDHGVSLLTDDPEVFERLSTYKGWLFVAVTSVLLYVGLRRPIAEWEREAEARQRAVVDAQQSEERFRMFVDQAEDAFFLHDDEGRIVDVNRHAVAQLGYTREELLGKHVWEIDADLAPEQGRALWTTAQPGDTQTVHGRHRRKDGAVLEVELRLACFESHGQRLFLAIARDVSPRRRQELLAEGERRILEMIAVGADYKATLEELVRMIEAQGSEMICSILIADREGRKLYTGASPGLPRPYVEAIEGMAIGPCAGSCGTAAHRGQRVLVEDIAQDPLWENAREVALRHGLAACWSTPFFGPDREVLGTFAVYYREVRRPTEAELRLIDRATHVAAICVTRHRVEQALRESESTLREAQNRLTSALEIGGIGTFVIDFLRGETIWDDSLVRLYGRPWRPEDRADPEPFLRLVHPDDRERVRREIADAISGRTRAAPQSEYRIVHPDGTIRWLATTARVELGDQGVPARLIGATIDVTARRIAEENFRQAQKVEAIGQLSGGIAHDFNNILTVIQAGVSFLELEKGLNASSREYVAEIKSAAIRAANLTRQLLTFSRRQAMQLRSVELNDIVTHMSRMLQRVLGEHIQMELRLASHDLGIFGDAGMLEQVVMNLAVNARDAMPGGGKLTIATRAVTVDPPATAARAPREGRFACLEVADTGSGIPDAALPHIFEPFFTTKEAGKGTGLGLATVAGIVEQHGGWVDVRTEVGRGTRFIVHIPLISARELNRARQTSGGKGKSGHETVLLVEDEAVVRALVRNLLTRSGYRVVDAANGPRAVELWNQHGREFDLLITDLIMPDGMSGFELARRLRQDRSDLRVIFTSGYSPEMVARQGEVPEDVSFLAKPFDVENLTSTVRAVLDSPAGSGRHGSECYAGGH